MKKQTENRGGHRPGSGRRPVLALGESERAQIITDVRAEAEKNGTSFGTELGKMIFGKRGERAEQRVRIQAMRLYASDVLPKISAHDVLESKSDGPAVYLPEQRPNLAVVKPTK